MAASYDIQLKVPFHDLDSMQVVWHGNYFKYFDVARFGLFHSVGIDLYGYLKSRQMVFPITRSSVKHILPLRFDDSFICRATVTEARYKIAMDSEIRLSDTGEICARGKGEQVAVKLPDMTLEFEIQPEITRALGC
ncbi:MAG: acyl-CoA thioesterase [Desulfosarcina sp.]|nr:acyl-CoA thioesterase [Desulfosarcina sp.]